MPKHIVCVHPAGPSQMVGDERVVTDKEWESMQALRAGFYPIWQLKRDMGKDVEESHSPTQTSEPTVVESDEMPEAEVRRPLKRSAKVERPVTPEDE